MPTYEYECEAGHRFDKVQKITDDRLTRCEICEAPVERLISASSFILKGGGWYAHDYTKKPGTADGDAAASPKADAKPAEGAAPKADTSSEGSAVAKAPSPPAASSGD